MSRINQWGQDNSFATDHPKDEICASVRAAWTTQRTPR